ncbi:MAG: NAD-dependent DNA ligase LigA [bacterium]
MKEKEEAEKRILELRKLLTEYDYNYYVLDDPLIDDYQYDILYRELKDLEERHPEFDASDSPTKRVSEKNLKHFEKHIHQPKMYSLDNTYSDEELKSFHSRIKESLDKRFTYSVEPKIDGTAISIIYRNSELFMALTRGDGETGDDVTSNIRTIRDLPLKLSEIIKGDIIVRGEVFFTKKRFEKLSETYSFSNPRNAASGTLKLQSAEEVSKRKLSILIHTVVTPIADTHINTLKKLSELKLPVVQIISEAESIDDLIKSKDAFEKQRFSLPYETDGVVIKLNQLSLREKVGFTSKSPKWAFAYKFTPKRAVTKLESVSFQVGRTGVITPVANLTPVRLSGTVVRRATLHNFEEMSRLGLKNMDFVEIEKSGEIIPKVLRVVSEMRSGNETEISIPKQCPSCGEKLVKYEDEVAVRCINRSCPEQIELSLTHFASKKAMNIENMGPSMVERLIKNNLLNSISAIYRLSKTDLLSLERVREKTAQNLLDAIDNSKSRPLAKLINGFGIRNVGEFAASKLAERFKNIDSLVNSTYEELIEVPGIGEESARAILLFFENKTNRDEIERLKDAGLAMRFADADGAFKGISFVLTGVLKNFTREKAEEYILSKGGNVQSDVSLKTDYLVVGESPGSKLKKAEKFSVKIITEDELLKMAEEK